MDGAKQGEPLKVVVQSVETKLFLTRDGQWLTQKEALRSEELLRMDPVEAIRLCLRLGIKNVKFSAPGAEAGTEASVYPFGGDPGVKAHKKGVRRALAEQRRLRSRELLLLTRIETIQQAQRATGCSRAQ